MAKSLKSPCDFTDARKDTHQSAYGNDSMYDAYWGLQRSVFTPAAVRQSLANSPVHAEALARLDFLCESRSPFGLLLGPPGSGKSTVLAEFAERATRGGALVAIASAATTDELAV